MPEPNTPVNFTDTELKIICLFCEDHSNKEIAEKLSLRKRAVDNSLKDITRKMNKTNDAGLVMYALQHGLYKLDPSR